MSLRTGPPEHSTSSIDSPPTEQDADDQPRTPAALVPDRHQHHHAHQHPDHELGTYTAEQRADLERVLALNRRLADATDACRDLSEVLAVLDPDPMRYMWVDEGVGRLHGHLAAAEEALAVAPALIGHRRREGTVVPGAVSAARPAVAAATDRVVHAWVEWEEGVGDRVLASVSAPPAVIPMPPEPPLAGPGHARDSGPAQTGCGPVDGPDPRADQGATTGPTVLSGPPSDCFRPSCAVSPDGTAWVAYGRRSVTGVSVHLHRFDAVSGWSAGRQVATTGHPSFNQELVAHRDGRVEVVWQGPLGSGFGIWSASCRAADSGIDGGIDVGPAVLISEGTAGNAWDPAAVALTAAAGDCERDSGGGGERVGGTGYAWSEYLDGSYRVVARQRDADGRLGPVRALSGGSDYALHPSLAAAPDGELWCAFDVIAVHGHGGSGPTRLRPAADLPRPAGVPGNRGSGEAVPPELLPDVTASIRVVRAAADGLLEPAGTLGEGLDLVPGGLPRLAVDATGALTVVYRVHRRLPLMTYYWEVAAQTLGRGGWSAPTTFAGSDGTLEEAAVAAVPGGVLVSWQTDGRLERSLTWTEGFGGRECPALLDHLGSVVWHGMHGVGEVRSVLLTIDASTADAGPARADQPLALASSSLREEARGWRGTGASAERYRTEVDGTELTLYWGDLHRHSLVSRCTSGDEPSLEDFYRYGWDVCDYDFWAVTDHSENSSAYQWWSIQKVADLFRVDGRFVPLYGFEWTGTTGHQNVIYGSERRGAPIYSSFAAGSRTPDELWASLRRHPEYPALTIPHHPGSAMVAYDWEYHDPEHVRLVEVFQACRGNYEAPGCFRQYSDATREGTFVSDGLRRGHRFGLIASSDHGNGASYVGAFADELSRDGVFSALQQRRVFAATTRDVLLDVRVAGAFMGSEVVHDGPVQVDIVARGFRDLARIELVRDGTTVRQLAPDLPLPAGWAEHRLRVEVAGGSAPSTDWSGRLRITGGRVLTTPWWSPEVVAAGEQEVEWEMCTRAFGEPYGSQRAGVELTLLGPPDAVVEVVTRCGTAAARLGDLADDSSALAVTSADGGRLQLQSGTGGLSSLGGGEQRLAWSDLPLGPAVYYVRAIQVDGEMAWSSPVWVDAG